MLSAAATARRLAKSVQGRDEPVVGGQHRYRRPCGYEGVAVGDPDHASARPAGEQGLDRSRDTARQLVHSARQVGVRFSLQPPRHQSGGVARSQREQDHCARPLGAGRTFTA
ncbi:hypothetical protein [Streptomyces ipomoeae]|uniref:hypothetical protein n=1 Tax=Streptomyces ipomoeae TaxID=103232 RepID=UPI0029B511A4|nr:hypothetical protein [Streptomyces ipomoeae]MDX2874525.1 hypothetical protein [Streptomyces ipomoeae]